MFCCYTKRLSHFCGNIDNILTLVMDGEVVLPGSMILQSLNVVCGQCTVVVRLYVCHMSQWTLHGIEYKAEFF